MLKNKTNSSSFSFNEMQDTKSIILNSPDFFKSSDNVKLAYYSFLSKKAVSSLIFIHGGGAYSGVGYQNLAIGLCEKYNISVYLLDLRGHGNSERLRGDFPSVLQVWSDLKMFISMIKARNQEIPLYLGGHSSGDGLILNYITWNKDSNIKSYFFISPEFGRMKSGTARRDNKTPFAKVKPLVFILYGMFKGKKFGNKPAVYFNYPKEIVMKQPLLLQYITCNMALSLTPDNPKEQFKNIDKPFHLFVGEKDELFVPENVMRYAELPKDEIKSKSTGKIIKDENHLSILLKADILIGELVGMNQTDKIT